MDWLSSFVDFEHPLFELSAWNISNRLFRMIRLSLAAGIVYDQGASWVWAVVCRISTHSWAPQALRDGVRFISLIFQTASMVVVLQSPVNFNGPTILAELNIQESKQRLFVPRYVLAAIGWSSCLVAFCLGTALPNLLSKVHPTIASVSGLAAVFLLHSKWMGMVLDTLIYRSYEVLLARMFAERCRVQSQRTATTAQLFDSGEDFAPFSYTPLRDARCIRLLMPEASSQKSAPAVCDLVSVSMDGAPTFDAISYCWGDETRTQSLVIGVEGKSALAVPRSVRSALQQTAPAHGRKYVWIDFVCINQEDDQEKTSQISLMDKIYGQARQVVGCLEGEANPCRASLSLQTLAETTSRHPDLPVPKDMIGSHTYTDPEDWKDLRALVANEYFQRRWIIQECVLAKRLTLLYRGFPVSWSLFKIIPYLPFALLRHTKLLPSSINPELPFGPQHAIALRQGYGLGVKLPLVSLLSLLQRTKASKPHDNVYSLMSICQDADACAIMIDYERSILELYTDVVRLGLSANSFITFSSICNYDVRNRAKIRDLPSWVCDLGQGVKGIYDTVDYHRRGYKAGGADAAQFRVSADSCILSIKAIALDTIKCCSSEHNEPLLDKAFAEMQSNQGRLSFLAQEHARQLAEIDLLIKEHLGDTYENEAEREEAFWRTLAEDYDGECYPARPILGDSFRLWRFCIKDIEYDTYDPTMEQIGTDLGSEMEMEGSDGITRDAGAMPVFSSCCSHFFQMHKFAITHKGYMAIVPSGTRPGDTVAIMQGAPAPHILRPTGEKDGSFLFWGEAYVHGVMQGSAMAEDNKTWFELR